MIKLDEFFYLLKKQDKLFMTILSINSKKDIQNYILSFYFHLFLMIKIDEFKNVFNWLTECIDNIVILNSINTNCIFFCINKL